jgi:hypothetical protein
MVIGLTGEAVVIGVSGLLLVGLLLLFLWWTRHRYR